MPSSVVRIGLLGCGVVGQGFLRLLRERERLIRDSVGATLRVTRVAVRDPAKHRECDLSGIHVATDPLAVANAEDVDLVIELIGGESMLEPVRAALQGAQSLGFAESDPTLDLSGADTAQKLAILVRRAFRMDVAYGSIPTEGIIGMELEDLRQADRFGYTVKLLGIALLNSEGLDLRVHPAFIPKRYLLAAVRDEFNGIYLRGQATGSMLFYRKGAGALPTAQAVLGDVIVAAREFVAGVRSLGGAGTPEPEKRLPLDAVRTKYYLRLMVEDRPGVLAQVAACLGGSNVSVAQMFQSGGFRGEASITILTHEAGDRDVREAVKGIAKLPAVRKTPRAVRIFDV